MDSTNKNELFTYFFYSNLDKLLKEWVQFESKKVYAKLNSIKIFRNKR